MERLRKAEKLLQHFPHGITAIDFAQKFGVHRTQAYEYLNSLILQKKAHQEGSSFFPKDKKESSRDLGFFGWLERRAERKRLERERKILDLEVEGYALREEILMDEDKYNSEAPEEPAKRRQKYRKILEGS